MGTKIQINSLAAVERLIGGDTETEIELRKSIVNEFTKAHLWKLIEDEELQKSIKAVTEAVRSRIEVAVDRKVDVELAESRFCNQELKAYWKDQINKYAERAVASMVSAEIAKAVSAAIEDRMKVIEDAVRSSVDFNVKRAIHDSVSARMKAALERAVRE